MVLGTVETFGGRRKPELKPFLQLSAQGKWLKARSLILLLKDVGYRYSFTGMLNNRTIEIKGDFVKIVVWYSSFELVLTAVAKGLLSHHQKCLYVSVSPRDS
jgi:hypothetical protein